MARHGKKIPRTTAFHVPFAMDSSDWERIERAASQSFSRKQRDELVKSDWGRIERAYGQSFSRQQRNEVVKITKGVSLLCQRRTSTSTGGRAAQSKRSTQAHRVFVEGN
jgi:protein-disulfide isomerase-like protein with CxxC motif